MYIRAAASKELCPSWCLYLLGCLQLSLSGLVFSVDWEGNQVVAERLRIPADFLNS